jgi:hypothetical protein
VDRSISQGDSASGGRIPARTADAGREDLLIGAAIVLLVFLVYALSDPVRDSPYDHFVRQAAAFLHGQAAITLPNPGSPGAPENGYFQDAMPVLGPTGLPTGQALLPFPPLPAVVLLPFVALFGLATNAQWVATILGAFAVGLAFWMLGRLPIARRSRIAATIFLGIGTVFWYAAMLGTTWFLAHVVAVTLTLLAIGVALGADPAAQAELGADEAPPGTIGLRHLLDGRQLLAGLLFGLACTSRLTVVFGAPFFVLVGGGGSWWRRALSAGLGVAIPVVALAAYNLASTGHFFHPAYEYQYRLEANAYTFLGYDPAWAVEDPRYLPQNLALMLAGLPSILPSCAAGTARGIFDAACPFVVPDPKGMSLLLTSPAWLLAIPALRDYGRSRIVTGATLAVVFIAIVNLMHFSQGWVQFGYRFSNDFAPFALLLVALGIDWLAWRRWRLVVGLIAVSVAIEAWGVAWGRLLGW